MAEYKHVAMCTSSLQFCSAWPQPQTLQREAGGQETLENVYILVVHYVHCYPAMCIPLCGIFILR